MNALIQVLSGKKTYFTSIAIVALLFGQWQGWWKIDPGVYTALTAAAIAFLRAGVAKGSGSGSITGTAVAGSPAAKLPPLSMFAFAALVFCATWIGVSGCASLQPGADPLVVNVERAEAVAQSSFSLVLNVDNSDRSFWQTNAPAFHDFCEWLRQPQTVADSYGTNTLPLGLAMLMSTDDVKNDYEASRVSSNALLESLATLESAANQAASWLTVVTNQTSP
ncbi:MAG: hypothetical protein WBN22_01095 [Verrucomicrobiia bacterium]